MTLRGWLLLIAACAGWITASAQAVSTPATGASAERVQREFFTDFNLTAAAADADEVLRDHPGDTASLFVRMETAALQQRTDAVLDAALRLCTMPAPPEIQEIASSRILENAGNSRVFNEVLSRVGLAMEEGNACTFNLRLALVAAAADGAPHLDLDKTAQSAGLLTRWRIAGPFGHFSNVDFERQWPPEAQQFWTAAEKTTELFWFRSGMASLPEYMPGPGVFYAASEVRVRAERVSQLDMLSSGPYVIFVDGQRVLARDSRFTTTGNRESLSLRLKPGRHCVVVKFTPDAAPFSVDVHPAFARNERPAGPLIPAPMAGYVHALVEYFRGNLTGVAALVAADGHQDTGAFLYVRALLWSAAEERSPRARAAWEAVKKAQPSAVLARIKAAEFALDSKPGDSLRAEITQLEQQRPDSEAAAQLSLEIARGDSSDRAMALARLLDIHPTCARLDEGIRFYSSLGDQDDAQKAETRLRVCAPESLAYARLLGDTGRHPEAVTLLEEKLERDGLNRGALRMLVQELVLAGELGRARQRAEQLHRIAPGSAAFAALVPDPVAVLDSHSVRATGFVSGNEFYAGYRRDGLKAVAAAPQSPSADSAATVLLLDRVLEVRDDGTASLYSHRVLRLINKDAISRYGEVALPRGSDLLELRTIKSNGQLIEPELSAEKSTVSMPALEPGDSMEEEFVTHFPDWRHLPPAASIFEFGSTTVPVVRSRYTLIAPGSSELNVELRNGAAPPRVDADGNRIIRTWQANDVPPAASEPFSPGNNLLPAVQISATGSMPDRVRDSLIDAARIGPHVVETVLGQDFHPAMNEREKARQLYRFVTGRLDSTGPDFSAISAEDTLVAGEGSRTAALLALARAAGLKSSLLLARRLDQDCAGMELRCYTEPLVRFWLAGQVIDADAEASDLPFGAVSVALDPRGALLVHLSPADGTSSAEVVSLSRLPAQERSIGEGDLFLDADGNLSANIHVRLGAARAQEIRAGLRGADDRQRQVYFEQLAARIFPGATGIHGQVTHLSDPEQSVELTLECNVGQFISTQSGLKETGQFAPALGLRSVFARTATRRFPLLIDSVLFESTVFHVHLPPGMVARSLPHDFVISSSFGEYAVRFSRYGEQIDIERDFRIPVQLITPEDFPAFAQFARRIEEAERQHLTLESRGSNAKADSARQPAPEGALPGSL